MAKKTKSKPELIEIELDPVLPLPAGTAIPTIKQGDGKEIFSSTHSMVVQLPFRAFYVLWEVAEARAAQQYPKYVGGPLDAAAQTALECVRAFRECAAGMQFPELSETEAQKIRARAAKRAAKEIAANAEKMAKARAAKKGASSTDDDRLVDDHNACPSCGSDDAKLKKKDRNTGSKLWKCPSCDFRWPRNDDGEAPTSPSERPRRRESTKDASKSKSGPEKGAQTAKKKSKKAKK